MPEQEVGVEISRGPFQPELSCDTVNPREQHLSMLTSFVQLKSQKLTVSAAFHLCEQSGIRCFDFWKFFLFAKLCDDFVYEFEENSH